MRHLYDQISHAQERNVGTLGVVMNFDGFHYMIEFRIGDQDDAGRRQKNS
jgi:hypothetical protein